MSDQKPENNLLKFIAAKVESLSEQMATKSDLAEMATKRDLEGMATKRDLEGMATKSDLEGMATKSDLEGMATKSDFESLRDQVAYLGGQLETVRDQMATKNDLAQLEERLTTKLEVEITAVRGDIEQVHLRLDSIERAIRVRLDRVEAEVSRLRSVLYLLVKDRPDMLRLLGHTPPAGDEGRP